MPHGRRRAPLQEGASPYRVRFSRVLSERVPRRFPLSPACACQSSTGVGAVRPKLGSKGLARRARGRGVARRAPLASQCWIDALTPVDWLDWPEPFTLADAPRRLALVEALPEPEPVAEAELLPPRFVPASVPDVAWFIAPVTVPARPTLPLAERFRRSTEPLALPFADPEPTALTLLAIEPAPFSAPLRLPAALPTL